MSDVPERIFACYDPDFDGTYWVAPENVYLASHSVGEYIHADKVKALVNATKKLLECLDAQHSAGAQIRQSIATRRARINASAAVADLEVE